jgi:hypothetical protein
MRGILKRSGRTEGIQPMTTRRNHYVPVWYQKGFVSGSPPRLLYLDVRGEEDKAVGGGSKTRGLQRLSPKQCFWSQDLYTTLFGAVPNDEIERFLFGMIDNDGAVAVRAVTAGDAHGVHKSFQDFFAYIDAQKMRTQKALDWIRARYGMLNQLELMHEMQAIRQMHCAMWMEAVREVVSAEESDVKFILTDHPVTVYNSQCPPDAVQCRYPEDPPIELIGSQTIFPLGANHCLILTNLEYTPDTSRVDLLRPRQNARHFGQTLARTDAWIRTRKLSRGDVVAINHVLKSRAGRYIAAAEEDWLYPERRGPHEWSAIATVLRPPENELWHFGGETYVGYEDGRSSYQDAFGRTSRSHEYLRKEPQAEEPEPDQRCPCGSGKLFRACCSDLTPEDRMPWDVYSIRERNLILFRAIEDILGLSRGKSWDDVRRELSDDQVKEIHTVYSSLWPKETSIADLLPRPDTRIFRALYVGLIDPRTISASVIAWLRYFDEILVLNPFTNGASMRPEFSPIDSPTQYKEQTIKNVALTMALVPFIDEGIVHLIPDPVEFNDTFRREVWAIAQKRRGSIKLEPEDLELGYELGKDDLTRTIARLPDESLSRHLRKVSPNLTDDKIMEVMAYIREGHEADPLALLQPLAMGKDGAQLQVMRGVNFELAVFLAQLTGAAIYSDQRITRDDLAAARLPPREDTATSDRFLSIQIALDINPSKIALAREEDSSQSVRASLRALWTLGLAPGEPANGAALDLALGKFKDAVGAAAEVEAQSADAMCEKRTRSTVFEIDAKIVIPPGGYSLTAVRRFLLAFGRRQYVNVVPLGILFGRAVSKEKETSSRSQS